MRKWPFWFLMCLTSLVNGAIFYGQSRAVLLGGIDGVENQASLLFIPVLWAAAAAVLVSLNLSTLMGGRNVKSSQKLHPLGMFRFSLLDKREITGRLAFLAILCLLMLFGYFLFNAGLPSAAYALSGGLLLLLLYTWQDACVKARRA